MHCPSRINCIFFLTGEKRSFYFLPKEKYSIVKETWVGCQPNLGNLQCLPGPLSLSLRFSFFTHKVVTRNTIHECWWGLHVTRRHRAQGCREAVQFALLSLSFSYLFFFVPEPTIHWEKSNTSYGCWDTRGGVCSTIYGFINSTFVISSLVVF